MNYLKNRFLWGIFDAFTPNSQTMRSIHRSESKADIYFDNCRSMASWSSSKDPNLSSKADDRDPNDLPLQKKIFKILLFKYLSKIECSQSGAEFV